MLFEGGGEQGLGDGMAARLDLRERSNVDTKELRRRLSEKLTTRKLKPDEDAQDFFHETDR